MGLCNGFPLLLLTGGWLCCGSKKLKKSGRPLEYSSQIDFFFFCLLQDSKRRSTRLQLKNGGENKPQSFRKLQKTYNYEPIFCTCFERRCPVPSMCGPSSRRHGLLSPSKSFRPQFLTRVQIMNRKLVKFDTASTLLQVDGETLRPV